MTTEEFFASTQSDLAPPANAAVVLHALWHSKRDEWDLAHEIAQKIDTPEAAWVHAHLHRVEGDETNARYWYTRAGKPHSKKSLADEWHEIVDTLLKK
jgi:hypothetical protein